MHGRMALIALIALALAPSGASAAGPETVIQDDALLLFSSDADVRQGVERVRELGIERVRVTVSWGAIAPETHSRKRPRFDAADSRAYPIDGWARVDRVLREVRRAGLKPMLDLAFHAPRWATRDKKKSKTYRDRPSVLEYQRFAKAAARRYRGDFPDPANLGSSLPAVRLWTTWNEPNHPSFLLPQWRRDRRGRWVPASPHLYRRMHNAAYRVLKKSSRFNRVLIGGLAAVGGGRRGPRGRIAPLRFLREMACVDKRLRRLRVPECRGFRRLQADGFSHHPYSIGLAPGRRSRYRDDVRIADLGRLDRLLGALRRRGRTAKRLAIYITEFGYETNPPDPKLGVSNAKQIAYLAQGAYIAWRSPHVRMHAQFLLRDLPPNPTLSQTSPRRWHDYQSGLIEFGGRLKPAFEAFKLPLWARIDRRGTFLFGQVRPGHGRKRVSIEGRARGGPWTAAGTAVTDERGYFSTRLRGRAPRAYRALWGAVVAATARVGARAPRARR